MSKGKSRNVEHPKVLELIEKKEKYNNKIISKKHNPSYSRNTYKGKYTKYTFTPKQYDFIQYYVVTKNALRSAIMAGYSKDTAGKIGYENLTKPEIKAEIDAILEAERAKASITKEDIVNALKEIAYRTMQKVPVMEFDQETKEWVQKIDEHGQGIWQFDPNAATNALKELNKMFGFHEAKKIDMNVKTDENPFDKLDPDKRLELIEELGVDL